MVAVSGIGRKTKRFIAPQIATFQIEETNAQDETNGMEFLMAKPIMETIRKDPKGEQPCRSPRQ